MSRRKSPVNDIRFDSVTDLPLSYEERQRYSSTVHKERQTPAIQQRVPKPSPTAQPGKYIPPHRRTSPPVYDQSDLYTDHKSAILTSCSYLANSINPTSPTSSSSPASYASILARGSSATPLTSTASTAPLIADSNTLYCSQCDAKFTGTHGRGNRTRHVKHKHTGGTRVLFKCKADSCTSVFARQDARLKHERQQHPELDSERIKKEPTPRMTEQAEEPSAVPSSIPFTLSIDDALQSARTVLLRMRARLDDTNYARFCDWYMTLLERLVQYLRDTNSDAHGAYEKVLDNMNVLVDAIASGTIDVVNQAHQDVADSDSHTHTSRPAQAARSSKNRNSGVDLRPKDKRRSNSNHKSTGRKASSHGKHSNVKITKRDHGKGPRNRAVDCPDHKHYIMLSDPQTSPPCGGCSEVDMSQIRWHLRRTAHYGRLGAKQCANCKKEFDIQANYEVHQAARNCQHQAQRRGDVVEPWARLYLARFPEAERIPSPYCDEKGWLPDSVLEECRAWLQNNSSLSFLGEQPSTAGMPYDDASLSNPAVSDDEFRRASGWIAWMGTVGSQVFDPLNGTHTADASAGLMNPGYGGHALSYQSIDDVLRDTCFDTAQLFGTPAEVPLNVQMYQLQLLANGATAAVHAPENYLQHQPFQHTPNVHTTAAPTGPPEFIYGSSQDVPQHWPQHNQPPQNEGYQDPHIGYHLAPSISTQSYTPDQYHGSSQYNISPQTGPSSTYESVDDMHFSPLASPYYPRTLQSSNFTDCPAPPIPRSDNPTLSEPSTYFDQYGDVMGAGQWNAH